MGCFLEHFLDPDQLVVFRQPVRARQLPVLICPQFVATARSAMVASSVSPERCDITQVMRLRCAMFTAASVSDRVPIWLTFTSSELAQPFLDPLGEPRGVGDEQVVAHKLHPVANRFGQRLPAVPVILAQPSSIDMIG
jgi:hypothetical protein